MNREVLECRWKEIAADLAEIAPHSVLPPDHVVTEREGRLLEEQDAIELNRDIIGNFACTRPQWGCKLRAVTTAVNLSLDRF